VREAVAEGLRDALKRGAGRAAAYGGVRKAAAEKDRRGVGDEIA